MSSHRTNSRLSVKALCLVGIMAALSCGRDVLVGAAKNPLDQASGGTGGSDPCSASNAGGTSFGGASGYGGNIGTAGTGSGRSMVSCPTISTVPGTLNACGRTIGIAYSPDGTLVATATETPTPNIHIWRLSDGALVRALQGHGGPTEFGSNSVAFSPDGTMLATAGQATVPAGCAPSSATTDPADLELWSEVKTWDVGTGDLLHVIPSNTGAYAYSAKFSHDGSRLVIAGDLHSIQIWNVADAALLLSVPVDTTYYDAQFSPDDARIVGAGMGPGGVWNTSDGSLLLPLSNLPTEMDDAAYSPDGSEIVAFGEGGRLQFFSASGSLLQSFVAHTGNYMSRAVWVDKDHVVSDDWGGNIKSWTRDVTNNFVASGSWSLGSQAFGIAVSPDGKTLAVGGDGGFMFIAYQPTDPVATP